MFVKQSQAISRTTGPNIGLFVLILMHFPYWFKIWAHYETILKFLKIFWRNDKGVSASKTSSSFSHLLQPRSHWEGKTWTLSNNFWVINNLLKRQYRWWCKTLQCHLYVKMNQGGFSLVRSIMRYCYYLHTTDTFLIKIFISRCDAFSEATNHRLPYSNPVRVPMRK